MSRGADRLTSLQPLVAPLFASMRWRAAIVVALHAAAFLVLCLTEDRCSTRRCSCSPQACWCAWPRATPSPAVAALSPPVCRADRAVWFKSEHNVGDHQFSTPVVDRDTVGFLLAVFLPVRPRCRSRRSAS
jgi:hypothetical protein